MKGNKDGHIMVDRTGTEQPELKGETLAQVVDSQEKNSEFVQILSELSEGGSLRDFARVGGGVTVHDKGGEPKKGKGNVQFFMCDDGIFNELRTKKLIVLVKKDVGGYPYYADNHRSDVYKISEAGKKYLE